MSGKIVALDSRGKRKRNYDQYENKDQLHHQEIVTPSWLVDELLEHIEVKKNVLDPCVGPGIFVDRLLETSTPETITVMDIQETHTERFK